MAVQAIKETNRVMEFNEGKPYSLYFKTFSHLFITPVLMGLGHLAPAIGAIRAATGIYQFPVSLFGMIATGAALVDCKSKITTHQWMQHQGWPLMHICY